MPAIGPRCEIHYRREDERLRVVLRDVTNHELREVLIGMWARLDADDRAEHLRELEHYAALLADPDRHPDRFLSPIAQAIKDGPAGKRVVDIDRRRREEHDTHGP